MVPSSTHLVLIPSYNTGPRLLATVREALRQWAPVWVVLDGSTDGSGEPVLAWSAREPQLKVITLEHNLGKGAAIEAGAAEALAHGYTHALTMDADGQHPAGDIPRFMAESRRRPEAMILGRPVFGPEAPLARCLGRKLSIALARAELLGPGIDDPLFGFRIYPLNALQRAFASTRWGRRFDFDHEIAVRAFWQGAPTVNLPAPCRYLRKEEGGVSHFRYGRDNLLLVWLQLRLLAELALWRWPELLRLRRRRRPRRIQEPVLAVAVLMALAAPEGGWDRLFQALALHSDRQATFVERRYLPFRSQPVVLRGTVRLSPEHGLSLDYATAKHEVIIADDRGVLLREPDGRQRPLGTAGPLEGAVSELLSILRFDPRQIFARFQVERSRTGPAWTLELRPRSEAPPGGFAAAIMSGTDERLRSIELIRSAREHIDIELGAPASVGRFDRAALARYFR
jgi:glycosyltransferase involved in cell wall biosynthesis